MRICALTTGLLLSSIAPAHGAELAPEPVAQERAATEQFLLSYDLDTLIRGADGAIEVCTVGERATQAVTEISARGAAWTKLRPTDCSNAVNPEYRLNGLLADSEQTCGAVVTVGPQGFVVQSAGSCGEEGFEPIASGISSREPYHASDLQRQKVPRRVVTGVVVGTSLAVLMGTIAASAQNRPTRTIEIGSICDRPACGLPLAL